MAEKKTPVGKGTESDGQAKVKKASTKKTSPVKKAAPKKKAVSKKKVTTEKKPVPKKQAAKKSVDATVAKSTEDLSKKLQQIDKTNSSAFKAEGKVSVNTDIQTPPPKPDQVSKKITLWPWITLFVLIGVTAYLLGGPLRKQNETEPSTITQQDQETSTASPSNVHDVEPVSAPLTASLNQGDEAKVTQESRQIYTTPSTTPDVVAEPNQLLEQAENRVSSDETESVQDPTANGHKAATEETTPAEETPTVEQWVQERPSDTPRPISKPDESNANAPLLTTADVQARADGSDQDPQHLNHEAKTSGLAEQAPDTLSSSQDTLNDRLPSTKPENEAIVSNGGSKGSSAEVGHTKQTAEDNIHTQTTAEAPHISIDASSSKALDEGSQTAGSQAEEKPKGVIGMPVPEHTNKQYPANVWGSYWPRWRQHVPRQYLPAYSYRPYYQSMRQYPYNAYRQRIPFPTYRPHRPYHPYLPRGDNN
jgi:hypothetical protein